MVEKIKTKPFSKLGLQRFCFWVNVHACNAMIGGSREKER